mgnify:CR=1 FL=1
MRGRSSGSPCPEMTATISSSYLPKGENPIRDRIRCAAGTPSHFAPIDVRNRAGSAPPLHLRSDDTEATPNPTKGVTPFEVRMLAHMVDR